MEQEDRQLSERAAQVGDLLRDIESIEDPGLREVATGVLQDLLAIYGEGLGRILSIVRSECTEQVCDRVLAEFAKDELVSHLLLLHDLHPVDLQTRISSALEEARPYLKSHGGNVEFIDVVDGVAHLRLQGSCNGCPGSATTLKMTIEEALYKAAPDLLGIEAVGADEAAPVATGFVPISAVLPRPKNAGVT